MNLGRNNAQTNKCMNVYPIPTLDTVLPLYSLQSTTEEERKFYLHLLPSLSKVACIPLANHLTTFEAIVLSLFLLVENQCAPSLSQK